MKFSEIYPGIYRGGVGKGDSFSPMSLFSSPKEDRLGKFSSPSLPFDLDEVKCESGEYNTITIPLTPKEKLYGLGLQFKSVEQRGKTRYLRVNSDPSIDNGETHAPVPFYLSSRNYAVLIDTSKIVTIYLGSTVRKDSINPPVLRSSTDDEDWKATMLSDSVEASAGGAGFDVYIFSGESMMECVQKYVLLSGGGALPPLWALGIWYRTKSSFTDRVILSVADEFDYRGYPLDVIGLEPGWHSRSYPDSYTWHPCRFPDPVLFGREIHSRGLHLNNWEHGWVSPSSPFYNELEKLSGDHTVWGGLAPDYSLEKVRSTVKAQHKRDHLSAGVDGYKLDECDGSEMTDCSWIFPQFSHFPSGHRGEEMRQNYGLLLQHMIKELYDEEGKRTWGLVRASGSTGCNMPFVLFSDLYNHRDYIRALYNSSFTGLLWTPEVRRAEDGEDWLKRIESVVFSPLMMINAWSDNTYPWSFESVKEDVRKYLMLRIRLLPYIYRTFAEFHRDGIPVMRSMELMYGDITTRLADEGNNDFDIRKLPFGRELSPAFEDQYFFGSDMLVAPLFKGETKRRIWLPDGIWFGLETGERLEGGRMIEYTPPENIIPVFVKDGTLIPTMEYTPRAGSPSDSVILVSYGNTEGSSTYIYDDDGETTDESGVWIKLTIRNGKIEQDGSSEWHFRRFSLSSSL